MALIVSEFTHNLLSLKKVNGNENRVILEKGKVIIQTKIIIVIM